MDCHYCGSPLDCDDVTAEQRLGISIDGPEGSPVEENFITGAAQCQTCGTHTMSVLIDEKMYKDLAYDNDTAERELAAGGESF